MSGIPFRILDSLSILERNIHCSRRSLPVVRIIPVSSSGMAACVNIPENSLALLIMYSGFMLVPTITGLRTNIPIWGKMMIILLMKNLWPHTLAVAGPGGVVSFPVVIPLLFMHHRLYRLLCLGGFRNWMSRLRCFEGILIKYLVKSISMDIKFFNGAGHLVESITSNFICLVNLSIGGVARMKPQEMHLVLVLEDSPYSFLMIILGNP